MREMFAKHITFDNFISFDRLLLSKDTFDNKLYALCQEIKFPCKNCNSIFDQKDNLQKHLNYECDQPPRFRCPYCLYLSKNAADVRKHIRRLHSGHAIYVIDLKPVQ